MINPVDWVVSAFKASGALYRWLVKDHLRDRSEEKARSANTASVIRGGSVKLRWYEWAAARELQREGHGTTCGSYFFKSSMWLATCVPSHLDMVYVSRLARQTGGPLFNTQSASYVYPVQIARVIDKLQKPYTCAEPLELLAYADRGEFSFATDLPALSEAVRLHLPGSAFRRVWAFEEMQRRATLVGEL